MKRIAFVFCTLFFVSLSLFAASKRQSVVLSCDIHCQGCCDKIMKNIAFEKGVKDIVCNLDDKTVTVTFDANKTDVPTLLNAFKKINKPATVKEQPASQPSEPQQIDAQTSASPQ